MRILVIGSGAREHAIVHRLLDDPSQHEIICAPGNAGIATETIVLPVEMTDPQSVLELAKHFGPDLVVVGPEAPLIAGVADPLREHGFSVFGPDAAAAALEGSKAFAKDVMAAAGVPTGGAVLASRETELTEALDRFGAPYVVKADGLAAGKGVIVTNDRDAAIAHGRSFLPKGPVLVEEFLDGSEVSLFFLSDGQTVKPLTPAQDYKRVFDGDEGPNTGGMGAYSPLDWLPAGFVAEVEKLVAQPTVDELARRGTPFVGLLYCGLIVTKTGTKVIEFNARFGDPETQVVLPRLKGEFAELLLAAADGRLSQFEGNPEFSAQVAITVVIASGGYPTTSAPNRPITGLQAASEIEGVHLIHAATEVDDADERIFSNGGRVLNVVAVADTFAEARLAAYQAAEMIQLEGSHYRTDIGARAEKYEREGQ